MAWEECPEECDQGFIPVRCPGGCDHGILRNRFLRFSPYGDSDRECPECEGEGAVWVRCDFGCDRGWVWV